MKNFKKLLLSLFLLAPLCSCDLTTYNRFIIPEGGYDGSKVTVKFYHTIDYQCSYILNNAIKRFNQIHPNITIKQENVGSYEDLKNRINSEIELDEQPAMAFSYPDQVALYNTSKRAIHLDEFINDTKEYSYVTSNGQKVEYTFGLTEAQNNDFIKGFYDVGRTYGDGLTYTMPFYKSTDVLYYNKTFFDKNNLEVPTTWDEMWDVCAKIKQIDKYSIPVGFDSSSNLFINMAEQMGSSYTSNIGERYVFDNEKNRKFVENLNDKYQKNYFTTRGLLGYYISSIFTETSTGPDVFKSYMSISPSSSSLYLNPPPNNDGSYPFEVGIAPLPQVDITKPKVISQGPDLVLLEQKDPQVTCAAWLFTKYLLTDPEIQAEFSMKSGYLPVIKSAMNVPKFKTYIDSADGNVHLSSLAIKVALQQENSYFAVPSFVGMETASNEVGNIIDYVVSSSSTIDEAFTRALNNCKNQK